MNTIARSVASMILVGCALACSDEPDSSPTDSKPSSSSETKPGKSAGSAASPARDGDDSNRGSRPGSNAMAPGMDPGDAPGTGPMAGGEAPRFPDACAERRGSWSKPCSNVPDPCGLNSGFPGDEYCLTPPPAGKGIQIHFGPSSYTDMAEVAKYVIQPGEEFNEAAIALVPTTETRYYKYIKISMRPGSHHLINSLVPAEGATPGFLGAGVGCEGNAISGFQGTQNLIVESPPQGIPAPENEGLGRELPGNVALCQNYHRYNYTDQPQLSEIWYNIWFAEESEITQRASGLPVFAGPRTPVPANSMVELTATRNVMQDGRIIQMFGHRHAATERFATWVNDRLVYDSWDWEESRLFNYDSLTQNPPIDSEAKTDGAVSGILALKAGDQVKISCFVNNTTDQALPFANELLTGEMCILFAQTVNSDGTASAPDPEDL